MLKPGGLIGCYLTTVLQIYSLMEEFEKNFLRVFTKSEFLNFLKENGKRRA